MNETIAGNSLGEITSDLRRDLDAFIASLSGSLTGKGGDAEEGSIHVASRTVRVLKQIVLDANWSSADDLMKILHSEGRRFIVGGAGMTDIAVGNAVRRVLKLVREDYRSSCLARTTAELRSAAEDGVTDRSGDGDPPDSLHNMVSNSGAGGWSTEDYTRRVPDLKDEILRSIDELLMELETSADEIADQALQHIHASEVILTLGRSRTVEKFLKRAAAKGRHFQVVVAEGAPFYHGHELAASLARAKIPTTVITDSAIFAMMSRVNKVIVGTHALLANGGLQGPSGLHTAALAARHYSVPFVVTASMHKLTPRHLMAGDREAFGRFVSPQEVLRGGAGGGRGLADTKLAYNLRAICPLFDYVPPDLVTLFISNISGHAPSYVYRLLSELYHPDDYEL